MSTPSLLGAVSLWAHRTPAIEAAILIGSQARPAADLVARPDASSDWDFQLVATRPARFSTPRWLDDFDWGPVRGYVVRKALWQGGLRVAVTFAETEADFVILPAWPLRRLGWLSAAGCHRREGGTRHALQGLIHYVRPAWRFLKGARWVESLYRRAAELPDPRLADAAVRQLAAKFWCEYRWILRQLGRGELRAAQRALHLELGEANFALQHELRLRRGGGSFEKARRLEQLCSAEELAALTISAECAEHPLRMAAGRAAATCRQLVHDLLAPGVAAPEPGAPEFAADPFPFLRHSGAGITTNQHNEQPANRVM
jgi:hypothetical protein